MELALKLEVHWPNEISRLLCVNDKDGDAVRIVVDDDEADDLFQSGYVELCGDDLIVKIFGNCNKVPDVSRYRIKQDDHCVAHDGRYHICNDRYLIPHCDISGQDISRCDKSRQTLQELLQEEEQRIGNIVLLLESPHKDEYNNGNIADPEAPGRGATGRNIDRCLATVLLHIQEIEAGLIGLGCHVVISNPIQFQTSLHAIHGKSLDENEWKTLRDNVWRTLWEEEHIKQCFRARLRTYYPKVIINACTGHLEKPDSLKSLVNRFFQEEEELRNVPLYAVTHPSSWRGSLRPKRINP